MYKFLTLLLITVALAACVIEAKDKELIALPTEIKFGYEGAIFVLYKGEHVSIY